MSQQGTLTTSSVAFPIATITGNSGGAITPDGAANINLTANTTTGINTVGTLATHTINIVASQATTTQFGTIKTATQAQVIAGTDLNNAVTSGTLFPMLISPFVVGPLSVYTTIQAGINAAHAAGKGTVYINPGTYVENLTLFDQVDLRGNVAVSQGVSQGVMIQGTHTPPTTGHVAINSICLVSTTDVFSSIAAGTAHIAILNCESAVQNGYLFNLLNWTGIIEIYDCNPETSGAPWAINDGGINNTGGAQIIVYNSGVGQGTNVMTISGADSIFGQAVAVGCPVTLVTGANLVSIGSQYEGTLTLSNNSIINSYSDSFVTGSTPALTMNSSSNCLFANAIFQSTNNPSIGGTGAGTLSLDTATFVNNSSVAVTVTVTNGGLTDLGSIRSNFTTHGILLGQGTRGTITALTPSGTSGTILQSTGIATDPAYSTATYPVSTTINQLLYSSANNVVSGLATANRAVLTTTAAGVPVATALAADGQLIIGSTAGAPASATLTAGTGITITNASNSITISTDGGFTWTDNSGVFTAAKGNGYFITATSTATLPASPSEGDSISFIVDTTQILTITGNTGQKIRVGTALSAAAGTCVNNARGDSIALVYRSTGTTWFSLTGPQGTWTIT